MIRKMTTEAPALPPRAPTPVQMRSFALLSAVYVGLTAAVVPWATEPGASDPHIVVVYSLAVLIANLCTALMLGALYRDSGRIAHLLLCCGYLYGGLMRSEEHTSELQSLRHLVCRLLLE